MEQLRDDHFFLLYVYHFALILLVPAPLSFVGVYLSSQFTSHM